MCGCECTCGGVKAWVAKSTRFGLLPKQFHKINQYQKRQHQQQGQIYLKICQRKVTLKPESAREEEYPHKDLVCDSNGNVGLAL